MTKTLDTSGDKPNETQRGLVVSHSASILHSRGYGSYGAHNQELEPPNDLGLALIEYWRIIYKRRWLIIMLVSGALALGILRTLIATPYYSAVVRLQIDRNVMKPVESGNVTPADTNNDSEFMKTQIELIQSRAIAERVSTSLHLANEPTFLTSEQPSLGWLTSFNPLASKRDNESTQAGLARQSVSILLRNRIVRPVIGARLVDIIYTDSSPDLAQKIAAAFGDGFIASQLDKRFQANSYAKTFLEDQVAQLKLKLELAEKASLEFAEKEQIVVVNERASIAENNLSAANTALGNLVSERIKNEELWKQASSASEISIPQILSNPAIDTLLGKRSALETEYQQKLETFKPSYPAMIQIRNQIGDLNQQVIRQVKMIKASMKAAFDASQSQEQEMKNRIEALRIDLLELQKRSVQYNFLKREVDTSRTLYESLMQRYKEVDIAGGVGTNNVFVVDNPQRPISPSSPILSQAILLSLAIGLGLGLASAYILEKLDDTIASVDDAERVSGLPILGVIPKIDGSGLLEQQLQDPRSSISEAYRSLCTSLQFSSESGLPKTISVTSAGPSEGKSWTTITIAKYFATVGLKVLIIDADMRKPTMHQRFACDNSIGLSNYLTGGCKPPEAMLETGHANLVLMPAGPTPPNAADLLSNSRFASLLTVGLEVFDLIIVDGPPVMGLADAPIISNSTKASIFVLSAGQARKANVRGALKRLRFSGSNLVGTILTKYDYKIAGYGGYGYGYDNYGYGEDELLLSISKAPR
jgi:polysaccharide biosynthesis transport protein